MDQSPPSDFNLLASKVFRIENGQIFLGGHSLDKQLRDSLREEAKVIQQSRLWEVIEATVIQEASDMALIKSTEWQHIENAKMLHHWAHMFKNIVYQLSK